jgi:hypothetical protein
MELDRFQLEAEGDLGERLQVVARLTMQTIDSHDPSTEWSIIESAFDEALNRATAGHLRYLKERAAAVYEAMEEFLAIPAGTLAAGRSIEVQQRVISLDLDRPDLAIDASGRLVLAGGNVSRYGWMSGSAVGGAVASVAGGAGLALLAGSVAGLGLAGAVAMFWRVKTKEALLEESRRRVRAQAQIDVAEASRVAALASRTTRSELHARLQEDVTTEITNLRTQLQQELLQLKRVADVADEHRPAKDRELEAQLERIRLVRAHAARLRFRTQRPVVAVPQR